MPRLQVARQRTDAGELDWLLLTLVVALLVPLTTRAPVTPPPPTKVCREAAVSGGRGSPTTPSSGCTAATPRGSAVPARGADGTGGACHAAKGAGRV